MSIENLLAVLGWCMVINFGVLLLWFVFMTLFPKLTYRTQQIVVDISEPDFRLLMYRMMGQFKLAVIILNVSPYLALRIVFQ